MEINNKRLGAIFPAATTYTTLYTPSGVKGVVQGISISNMTATQKNVRLSNIKSGENATNLTRCILYDYRIPANTSIDLKYMVSMSSGDSLKLYTDVIGIAGMAWGSELTGIGENIQLLGGVAPVANRNTVLYTVGSAKKGNISTISVCNRSISPTTFRIAHTLLTSTVVASKDYIAYNQAIYGSDSLSYNLPISMVASNSLIVRTATSNLTFMCWGSEIY